MSKQLLASVAKLQEKLAHMKHKSMLSQASLLSEEKGSSSLANNTNRIISDSDDILAFFKINNHLCVNRIKGMKYHFVSTPLNWTEAQSYCRQVYTDLATAEDTADISAILSTTSNYTGTVNGEPSFVVINTTHSWKVAQSFCRENYVDLASVRNDAESEIIRGMSMAGSFLWIGLHREKLWSDRSFSQFRYWAAGQPDSRAGGCVTTAFNHSGRWSDDDCFISLPFICYKTIPPNAESFRSVGQDETTITLQWNKVNNNISFILQFNGTEIFIPAPDGHGPVTHSVSSLTAGTKYTFTLFSVIDNIRSSGVNISAVTAPPNAESFRSAGQDETSITLQWNKVNNNVNFILQFNGTEIFIPAPDGSGPVTQAVSSLTAGTKYTFTLFSVFENVRSSGRNITAVTAPVNAESFRSAGQDETSITLQWNQVDNISFILQFNGTEVFITAPDGDGPVTHKVSSLTAGTKYTLTLFSVFEDIRSSGLNITAVTAPPNAESFRLSGQDETSITLQWNRVNHIVNFILHFNGSDIYFTASDGDGLIIQSFSPLTPGTKYTFTLFSVFENVRSSGRNITAVTAPLNAESFRSAGQSETSITLQWNQVNNNVNFTLQFNGTEIFIPAPDGGGPVAYAVSSLTAGTKYTFTLFSVFEDIRSSGLNITAVTAPPNAESFRLSGQDETSITLQWNRVNHIVSFILHFNGSDIYFTASDGDGLIIQSFSPLTPGTKYTFTLFSVFENVKSSGRNITAVTAPPNAESFRLSGQDETSITLQWNRVNHINVKSSGRNITAVTAPLNAESFRSAGQSETSITLQWNQVNNNVNFTLQFNGTEIFIPAPDGGGPVAYAVSSLTAGTKYTFTLFSVFEDIRSSGLNITAVTAPPNAESFRLSGQDETSITLQWNRVNHIVSFILHFNGSDIYFTASDGDGLIIQSFSPLTPGTKYTFTLFSVFENVRSSGRNITAVTAPLNAESFRSAGQSETSITLQWNKVNNNVNFTLEFDGTAINITAPDGDGPVAYTVSSLTAGTKYTFTLFSVFENVRSSGLNITTVTAPPNAEIFRSAGQNETSITLQWNQVNNIADFILQFNGTEIFIPAPDGGGPVAYAVSSLTAGTTYAFTLFSVFENIRSSGVNITAVTAPPKPGNFRSAGQDETSITLQWNKVNNNVSFLLQYNGIEIYITPPDEDGPVTYTASSLTARTTYTFTLFSVFESVRSRGVHIVAVTVL
ncbi:LOW QUALITY PROTEIN: receptor-type tyrosine-protein phosphatase eta-like [Plectropomus leopardus]|uniref:LOW QUALITY PROTEIN: receptor-type tyrosine-protein phosphatase eta-like n=1 Tax=Plectropomus leopardus TaxID=160734 RepID=UPI001C4DD166|nr:LOW QUALITY PROTEIN: receptor-type tyrosine-protein phosphatase eta-like [Plectropomus leopardus]